MSQHERLLVAAKDAIQALYAADTVFLERMLESFSDIESEINASMQALEDDLRHGNDEDDSGN